MRKFIIGLLFAIRLASPAAAYDWSQNTGIDAFANGTAYDGNTTGLAVWGTPSGMSCQFCTAQGTTKSFHIVTTGHNSGACFDVTTNHKCIEFAYPAGHIGAVPGGVYGTVTMDLDGPFNSGLTTMEYDFLLETGYDLHSIGKIAPTLRWYDKTPTTGATQKPAHLTTNWQCTSGISHATCASGKSDFVTYFQNDFTGGHQGCVSTFYGNTIQTNQWYHVKSVQDMTNTAAPIVQVFINGPGVGDGTTPVQMMNCAVNTTGTNCGAGGSCSAITVQTSRQEWSYGGWFGGGNTTTDAALVDSYELVANGHWYTGTPGGDPVSPPSVPINVATTLFEVPPQYSDTQISVTWGQSVPVSPASVASYTLQHNNNGGAYSTIATPSASGATAFTDTGLTQAHTYCYKLNAIDNFGNTSAFSTPVCLLASDVTAPTLPPNLKATVVNSTKISLNWSASINQLGNPITYHEWVNGVDTKQSTTLGDNLTGLTPSTTYTINLTAVDTAGNSSAHTADVIGITTVGPDTTPPSVPTGFVAAVLTAVSANVTWPASTDDFAVDHYTVSLDSGSGYVTQGTTISPSWSFSQLSPSTTYNMKVSATDQAGNTSALSSAFPITTLAGNSNFMIFQMVPGSVLFVPH